MLLIEKEIVNNARICVIGDLHIGAKESMYQQVEQKIDEEINKCPVNTYLIFLGDLADYAIVGSKGDVYEAAMKPEEQKREVKRLLKKYQEHTLLVVEGNHEYRLRRFAGVSDISDFCLDNNIPYTRDLAVLALFIPMAGYGSKGRAMFTIAAGHGYSGARSVGGKISANGRIMDVIENADIYLTGHTHQPHVSVHSRFVYSSQSKKLLERKIYFVTVPSWLGYAEYAAKKFMAPCPTSFIHLFLSVRNKEKNISVVVR